LPGGSLPTMPTWVLRRVLPGHARSSCTRGGCEKLSADAFEELTSHTRWRRECIPPVASAAAARRAGGLVQAFVAGPAVTRWF
jgi:hypothetical protein